MKNTNLKSGNNEASLRSEAMFSASCRFYSSTFTAFVGNIYNKLIL